MSNGDGGGSNGDGLGRRRLLRAAGVTATAALAGCGRGVRANRVPGGLRFVNERPEPVRVVVRALLEGETPSERQPTPLSDTVTVEGAFPVPAETTRTNRNFFPQPGSYVVEARVRRETATGRIRLYETVGGGLGADTVTVRVGTTGDVSLSVSEVD
ncbi:hypothetical protein [Halobaculum sp. MBLA0143]|uniref:hypothetical protein n=1 Tax=Halobaculum sp. MBLA0143 TaxID=3079933 RepID=UPI00352554F5